MKTWIMVVVVVGSLGAAGQTVDSDTYKAATERLRARTATQPATTPTRSAEVISLQKQVAELEAEVAALKQQLAAAKAGTVAPTARPSPKTSWREALKVGMTEAEADEVFNAIPRNRGSQLKKRTESVGTSKSVSWLMETMTYRIQGTVQVPAGARTDRLCTIVLDDGKVTSIDY